MFRVAPLAISFILVSSQLQQCPPGWALPKTLLTSTSRCYNVIDVGSASMTWTQAAARCRALLPAYQSSLAAIRNPGQVQDVVYDRCGGFGVAGEPIWLGLMWPPGLAAKGSFEASYNRGCADRSAWVRARASNN